MVLAKARATVEIAERIGGRAPPEPTMRAGVVEMRPGRGSGLSWVPPAWPQYARRVTAHLPTVTTRRRRTAFRNLIRCDGAPSGRVTEADLVAEAVEQAALGAARAAAMDTCAGDGA